MPRPNLERLQATPLIGRPVRLLRQLKYALGQRIHLYQQSRNPLPAILVYQMGKVGSRTVYKTLLNLGLPNPIYHVHWLSPAHIRAEEERYRRAGARIDWHLHVSRSVRRLIERQPEREWWIITLVRDPIARQVSELFEGAWLFHPDLMTADGGVHVDKALTQLTSAFAHYDEQADRCYRWFESDLKPVFDVDLFNQPFDQEAGYGLIEHGRVRLLALRLEDLDRNTDRIGSFVGHPAPLSLVKANVAENKSYAAAYQTVTTTFKLPASLCRTIYDSRYARHFYSPEMRAALARRWSQEEGRA